MSYPKLPANDLSFLTTIIENPIIMNRLREAFVLFFISAFVCFGCSKDMELKEEAIISLNQVEAMAATAATVKHVQVNLYGGSNAYSSTAWNNWNVSNNLSSGPLKYSDGKSSVITMSLSAQSGMADNGSSYTSKMAPQQVVRYTSYSTSTRTLTIAGLNNNTKYNLSLYASRSGGTKNTTRYTVGSKSIDILTDTNTVRVATFTSLAPSSGQIKVTIAKLKDFNYLNAVSLTEQGAAAADTNVQTGDAVAEAPVVVGPGCNKAAGKAYILRATSGNEIYIPNAASRGWKGGDTVKIVGGTYSLIHIANFKGDSCRPLVITNTGGQVKAEKMRIPENASYFKLIGNGVPGVTYGFRFSSAANIGLSMAAAHHAEIAYVEVANAELGFYFKMAPVKGVTSSQYPNFVMSHLNIHHNYIHDIRGEGMYIGHTAPNGDPFNGNLIPVRLDKVEIAYNRVENTDWDGIQLSNARSGASIHHNTVKNFGRVNKGSQQAGIILGGNTTGSIYNNTVSTGTGNGIQVFGYGTIKVYSNTVENVGKDGTAKGQDAIFCNDPKSTVETNPKQQMMIYDNTVRNPMPKSAIKVGTDFSNSLASQVKNNKLYVSKPPSNWLPYYIISYVPGSTITGNTMN